MTDLHPVPVRAATPWSEMIGDWGTALLRALPAEVAHEIGLYVLKNGWLDWLGYPRLLPNLSGLRTSVAGIGDLPHPIGLAAGFDKNAVAPAALAKLGFSFLEVGSVTPLAQSGNQKPRMFRQKEQFALINRMGFNNDGLSAVRQRIDRLKWDHNWVPLGVNVGKNKATPEQDAISDYDQTLHGFQGSARYMVVNLSSPNTEGLRNLESVDFIRLLAERCAEFIGQVWIKLDPDLSREQLQELVAEIAKLGFRGIILTNTHRVLWPEMGGQSGHPVASFAQTALEWAYDVHKGSLPMIASGGILSGADVFARLARGACAVQIYTALVYRGPWVVAKLLAELIAEMKLRQIGELSEVVGSHYR